MLIVVWHWCQTHQLDILSYFSLTCWISGQKRIWASETLQTAQQEPRIELWTSSWQRGSLKTATLDKCTTGIFNLGNMHEMLTTRRHLLLLMLQLHPPRAFDFWLLMLTSDLPYIYTGRLFGWCGRDVRRIFSSFDEIFGARCFMPINAFLSECRINSWVPIPKSSSGLITDSNIDIFQSFPRHIRQVSVSVSLWALREASWS